MMKIIKKDQKKIMEMSVARKKIKKEIQPTKQIKRKI